MHLRPYNLPQNPTSNFTQECQPTQPSYNNHRQIHTSFTIEISDKNIEHTSTIDNTAQNSQTIYNIPYHHFLIQYRTVLLIVIKGTVIA